MGSKILEPNKKKILLKLIPNSKKDGGNNQKAIFA